MLRNHNSIASDKNRNKNKAFRALAAVTAASIAFTGCMNDSDAIPDCELGQSEFYTVKSGDTIWDIAQSHTPNSRDVRKTVDAISEANGINGNPHTIQIGQKLLVCRQVSLDPVKK